MRPPAECLHRCPKCRDLQPGARLLVEGPNRLKKFACSRVAPRKLCGHSACAPRGADRGAEGRNGHTRQQAAAHTVRIRISSEDTASPAISCGYRILPSPPSRTAHACVRGWAALVHGDHCVERAGGADRCTHTGLGAPEGRVWGATGALPLALSPAPSPLLALSPRPGGYALSDGLKGERFRFGCGSHALWANGPRGSHNRPEEDEWPWLSPPRAVRNSKKTTTSSARASGVHQGPN